MFKYFIHLLLITTSRGDTSILNSNEILGNTSSKRVQVYWNIPTFQCDYHKLNFAALAEKYNITMNNKDRFRGGNITILYDPGDFPAILKNETRTFLRNGGVPQEGNLTKHLEIFQQHLDELIPNYNFSGIAIIDFESWRPIYRQNFGTLAEYQNLSLSVERKKHPLWPQKWIEREATKRFEYSAKQYMEETLLIAKYSRPKATWGYYAYPYCFNMSPKNMREDCPKEVVGENNRLSWLYLLSDNFYPSLYVEERRLTSSEKVKMVEGRIGEAHRLMNYVNKNSPKQIIPYFWYKYLDTKNFVSKDDLFNILTVLSSSDIDALVIWGSSNDVNTKSKCLQIYQYIDDVLGPLIINIF